MATGFVGAGCYNLIAALREIVTERSGDCLLLVDIPTDNDHLKCLTVKAGLEGTYTATDDSDESFDVVITSDTVTFTPPEQEQQIIYTYKNGIITTLYENGKATSAASFTTTDGVPTSMTYDGTAYTLTVAEGYQVDKDSSLLAKLAAETTKLGLSKYCAPFAPLCNISGLNTEGAYSNSTLPASFYYLACAINAEENLGYRD